MLDSPITDIVIGLSFLYFLLALFASSINELIQTKLKTRAKLLHAALINFLDRDWDEIGEKIVSSPYVRSLEKSPGKFPSYLPSSAFAQGIIDVIKGAEDLPEAIPLIREQIKKSRVIKGDAEVWLLGLLDRSYGKLQNFHERLEEAYNNAMERVSGWYGRNAKRNILLIGIITSILLNIDTLHITSELWKNKESAKILSAMAAQTTGLIEKSEKSFVISDEEGRVIYSVSNTPGTNAENLIAEVGSMPIPLGWDKNSFSFFGEKGWAWVLLLKLLGWAITALAIFLGAPFWFDVLNKVVNLRGAGGKPALVTKKE